MIVRALTVALVLTACCRPQPAPTAPQPPTQPKNFVYLYARLQETQSQQTATAQYLTNLQKSLADYEAHIAIEEITGATGEVEFIGVDFKIAAPESATEALESRLMDTFRLSGAPYATQIFIVTP